jgi:hypothetical protein
MSKKSSSHVARDAAKEGRPIGAKGSWVVTDRSSAAFPVDIAHGLTESEAKEYASRMNSKKERDGYDTSSHANSSYDPELAEAMAEAMSHADKDGPGITSK